jgi:hypothetical protein
LQVRLFGGAYCQVQVHYFLLWTLFSLKHDIIPPQRLLNDMEIIYAVFTGLVISEGFGKIFAIDEASLK